MIKAQGCNSRMSELYVNYLQCKGDWNNSCLVVAVRKRHRLSENQMWEFLTREGLIEHLKSAELADDLIRRHQEAEAKLSLHLKGRFIRETLI